MGSVSGIVLAVTDRLQQSLSDHTRNVACIQAHWRGHNTPRLLLRLTVLLLVGFWSLASPHLGSICEGSTIERESTGVRSDLYVNSTAGGVASSPQYKTLTCMGQAVFGGTAQSAGTRAESGFIYALNISPPSGSLKVSINPIEATLAGGQWRRAGTLPWMDDGVTEGGVATGPHVVEFRNVTGWVPPSNQPVVIASGQLTEASGSYTPSSSVDDIRNVILGVSGDSAGLDYNADGKVDISDMLWLISKGY